MNVEKQRSRADSPAMDVKVQKGHAAGLEVDGCPRPGLNPAVEEGGMADDADDVRFFLTQNLIIYGNEVSRSQGFMGMELPDWQLLFQIRCRLASPYIGTDPKCRFSLRPPRYGPRGHRSGLTAAFFRQFPLFIRLFKEKGCAFPWRIKQRYIGPPYSATCSNPTLSSVNTWASAKEYCTFLPSRRN